MEYDALMYYRDGGFTAGDTLTAKSPQALGRKISYYFKNWIDEGYPEMGDRENWRELPGGERSRLFYHREVLELKGLW
jgi:hypothetical protein